MYCHVRLELWLSLFVAKTEEDLAKIEQLEVMEMSQATGSWRDGVTLAEELKRLRFLASCNEASALFNAEQRGRAEERARADAERARADELEKVFAEQKTIIDELKRQLSEGK